MPEIQAKGQWVLSAIALACMLVTITLGWVLVLMGCFIRWGCTKLNAAPLNPMNPSHRSIWRRYKCSLSVPDVDAAISKAGPPTSKESGS